MEQASAELLRKVSVVIPTLNEGKSIGAVLDEIPRGVLEVIIVDGNSTDGTQGIARAKGARVVVEPRRGYGRAYKTGFEAARGTYILTLDADLTYPPDAFPEFLAALEADHADFVSGERMSQIGRAHV